MCSSMRAWALSGWLQKANAFRFENGKEVRHSIVKWVDLP